MKEPWSIKSRARECAASGEPFADGEKIRAAIFPDPDSSGYLRRDYKLACWEKRGDLESESDSDSDSDSEQESPFSTWLTTYHPPVVEQKTEDVVEQDPETLLHKMVEEDEEHTENARYILAVMLERKKLLRETDTQTVPSGILRVYEHRKTGDVYLIKDPGIALADVDQVQEEVRQLLNPEPLPQEEPAAEEEPAEEKPAEGEESSQAASESSEDSPDSQDTQDSPKSSDSD